MFEPKYIKQARLLQKGVRKFLRYKRDVLSAKKLGEIEELRDEFAAAVDGNRRDDIDRVGRRLTEVCEGSLPHVSNPVLRENLEVFFVAIVIAVGIRTYFLQPFKIPTGSMQPTLNGINGYRFAGVEGDDRWPQGEPGFLSKAFQLFWHGRNYVNVSVPTDDAIVGGEEVTRFRFFTFTMLRMKSGDDISVWSPIDVAYDDLGLNDLNGLGYDPRTRRLRTPSAGVPVREGQQLLHGFVDTGDQVLVDKVSYHFRSPRRGEVFVFNTKNIRGIESSYSFRRQEGAQHYIKRLAGLPGDHLETREPELWINGKRAEEEGFQRVMDSEPGSGFAGYQDVQRHGTGYPLNIREITVPEDMYFAMGDNSFHSFDSRMWGPVPERNLLGPALMVYWPFAPHWGFIN